MSSGVLELARSIQASYRERPEPHDVLTLANEVVRLSALAEPLVGAARLTVQHFKRNQVSGNFQGDDEHEAWTALDKALCAFAPPAKGGEGDGR